MGDDDAGAAADRFRTALDMFEFGEAMMRQRITRENPGLTADEIETRLVEWLHMRPGAEDGDAVGRSGTWPRTRAP